MMTPQEHRLMTIVLAQQMQFTRVLVNILKSRGVIMETDDLDAFHAAARLDTETNLALMRDATASYLRVAKDLGIETGLDNPLI